MIHEILVNVLLQPVRCVILNANNGAVSTSGILSEFYCKTW